MTSWGSLNAALNRLVREGVISAYKTNVADGGSALGLHVIVQAPHARARAAVEAVRRQVAAALDPLSEGVTVTVDRSAGPPPASGA